MDGINAEAFYCRRKMKNKQDFAIYLQKTKSPNNRNKNSPIASQRNITHSKNSSRNHHVFTASHREEKLCDNTWILDSGASCHMSKESVWFKNISPEVMDIYLADKNSKMMSQGTGNVSAKTVSTKHCNSINLTITNVSYVPQLRCNLLSVTCSMDKGCSSYLGEIENETWNIDSFFEVSPERSEINQNTEKGVSSNLEINKAPVAIENNNSSSDHVIAADRQNPTPGAKKEDLRRIASELELCVSDKVTVLDLMDLIKNCDRYKNDPDSVHELANLIIEERKYDESQQLELEK
ncbi:retrovirus-related Pol polyprotein from transposon TNT 1-94 [Trichonephila clavipes]|nr:retrovirus-related Pol polyprotein from transposon TNT 1-94 [Trichonephila clavipes]